MNTKNLLLICLFLLVTSTAATVVSYKQKALSEPIAQNHEVPAPQEFQTIDLVAPLEKHDAQQDAKHKHPDDDGKYHYFHFERMLQYRRGRVACIFCAKTVLIIIHLAVLLLGYLSLLH